MLLVSGERDVPLTERIVLFAVCNHASLGASWDWEGAERVGWSSVDGAGGLCAGHHTWTALVRDPEIQRRTGMSQVLGKYSEERLERKRIQSRR